MSKLPHIQLLRAFAALCVVAFHAQNDASVVAARLGKAFTRSEAFPWLAGVDIFFVISGFIMVYASARLFGSAQGPRIFLAHRIARIVPLYWATTMLYLAVVLLAPALLNSEYLAPGFVTSSFLFIPAARPDGLVQPLYSLGWTLNYEMFFYALFAIAVAFPRQRAVAALIGALILIVGLGQTLAPLPQPLAFWSDPIILEFAFGMALGWASAEGFFLNGPARLGFRGWRACAFGAGRVPTVANGSSPPPRLWIPSGLSCHRGRARFAGAARCGRRAHPLGRDFGRRLLCALSSAPLCDSRPARARHADGAERARRTLGPCDVVHCLRRGGRNVRESVFRAPDHAVSAAIASTSGDNPILRGARSRA